VFATMINLFLVVLGWFSFRQIGIDQFPNVELPIVTVTTTLRGASPEEMETSVTRPLEEIINTVQGIDELSSTTIEGVSRITIQFFLERNRDIAAQDVRDKVNTILSQLPQGTDPPIIDKFDLDAVPVMSLSVSAPRDLKEITYLVDKQIKQILETVPDVGAVIMSGGRTRAVQVAVDIDRLRARGLTVEDVRTALARSEEHTSELQSRFDLVCRLLLEKKKIINRDTGRPGQCRPTRFGCPIAAYAIGEGYDDPPRRSVSARHLDAAPIYGSVTPLHSFV